METITLNKTQSDKLKILCSECKRSTNHEVILSADIDGREDFDEHDWISWEVHYQIVQCKGCDSFSFRKSDSNSEDHYQVSETESETIINESLYPKRNTNTLAVKEFINTPYSLRRIYREVIESFNNGIYTLCGV